MILNFIIIILLVGLSAYFSGSETAFSAVNRLQLKKLADDGNKKAKRVLKLTDKYDALISTILIGNNIVNLSASSLATITAAKISDSNWSVTIATATLTVVVLVFGEISPKSMAKESAENFAMFSAPFMQLLVYVLTPLNIIFMAWKKLMTKIIKPKKIELEIEEELLTFVDEAENEGDLNEDESDLIRNAIEFNETVAEDIYTPRVDMVAVNIEDDREKIRQTFIDSGFSRLPVYEGTIDNIIGVINYKDFTNPTASSLSVAEIMSKPLVIVPSVKLTKLLSILQKKKSHIAILVDEYGGTMGMVTMEDVVEELVGEIWDEHDEVIEEFTKLSDNRYRVLCTASLKDMFDCFDMDNPDEEQEAVSVSGWVTEILGKIPQVGDSFKYSNLYVSVIKCDERHVEEIIVEIREVEEDV
ncbi:MAG: HlyC/CorC family transporter [Ruminococcaceae bacterium]|nr:HlyC/CorC family transporter [Oscillospiraceae bacterium]